MIFDPRKFFFLSLGTVLLMLAVVMLGRGQDVRCKAGEYMVLTNPPSCARAVASSWQQSESEFPSFLLEVQTADGSIVGGIFSTGQTWVSPIVANVCSIPRFRRNLRAALGGSALANRYLTACAKRLVSGYGN